MLTDVSGNSYNLTNFDTAYDSYNRVKGNGSLQIIDGSYLTLPSSFSPYKVFMNAGITFYIWVKVDKNSGTNGKVFDFQSVANSTTGISLTVKGSSAALIFKIDTSEYAWGTTTTEINSVMDNNFHLIVWSIAKNGVWSVYVDGTKQNVNIIFDVGSRDLEEGEFFAKRYPNSTVYAFECNPATIPQCLERQKKHTNIHFYPVAVNEFDGKCKFYPTNPQKTITTYRYYFS